MFVVSHSDLLNKVRISVNYNDILFQNTTRQRHFKHIPIGFLILTEQDNIHSINRVLGNYVLTTHDFQQLVLFGFY